MPAMTAINPTMTRAKPARNPVMADQRMINTRQMSNQFVDIFLYAPEADLELRAGEAMIRLLILFTSLSHDLFGKDGPGRLLVPGKRFQIIADILLIERDLRTTRAVGVPGPISRGIGG